MENDSVRPNTLAALEAVPKILSIHEVNRTAPASSPAATPRFSSTPPSPGTPVNRVNSTKLLGDDIVPLGDELSHRCPEPNRAPPAPNRAPPAEEVDFLSEFDPFRSDAAGAVTSTASAAAPDVDLGELFAELDERPHADTACSVERPQRLVAELPKELEDPSPKALAEPLKEHQEPKASRLVAELNTLNESEVAKRKPRHERGRRLKAELAKGSGSGALRPLPDGCELDAPSIDLEVPRGRPWLEGSHRRGRSLDATVPVSDALDLQRSIPQNWEICERPASSSQARSRSADLVRPAPVESEALQKRSATALQVWQTPQVWQSVREREVLQIFQRLMQQGDLYLLDAPGQAYLKYCDANSRHEEVTGSKSGDAFRGMARSLSLAADRICFESGVPATREERLDLGIAMLESAIAHGCSQLGQARSDPALENLRRYRSPRFAALMEHVPATGLDALAMTASAGVQQLAAVAGIQPLSFAPAPPAELPVVAPPGPPPELALQALETVTDLQLVEAPVEVSSETASEADPEGDASEDESASSEASSESASDASAGAGASDASAGSVSDEGSGSEEDTPKGAWASLVALFGW